MSFRELAYRLHALRLRRQLRGAQLPKHVGLIIDGNRRWARQEGLASPSDGHRHGAEHIWDALSWCERAGIKFATVFVCSAENLTRRGDAEVSALMEIIEQVVLPRIATPDGAWQLHAAGLIDMLPASTAVALKDAVDATRSCTTGANVTLCIGYGGRQEIVEAVRGLLTEQAAAGASLADIARTIGPDDIASHLAGAGQPKPDLIIRTSGEQRLSNFMLWQGKDADLHFCDCYWPAFREIDFLRALRDFAARRRRAPD